MIYQLLHPGITTSILHSDLTYCPRMQLPNLPPQIDRASASTPAPSKLNVVGSLRERQQVRQFPQSQSAPAWLKSLLTVQQGAMVIFSSVLGLSTLVYGYTVYTQSLWRSQHGQLERLQLQESQQGMMNEHLKQDMAQAAERVETGLIAPSPDRLVFIPSAPQRPMKPLPTAAHTATSQPPSQLPVGY
jgi:hypothetical protein